MSPARFFRATWEIDKLPDDLDEFHISCGIADSQGIGYFATDIDTEIRLARRGSTYFVTLIAPTRGLESEDGYWTSANQVLGRHDGEVHLI